MPCLTLNYLPELGPVGVVGIAFPQSLQRSESSVFFANALFDTGASHTCISKQLAEKADLPATGYKLIASASDLSPATNYFADLALPFGDHSHPATMRYLIRDIEVTEFRLPHERFDILLGRDVLGRGLFQMSGHHQHFTFCI